MQDEIMGKPNALNLVARLVAAVCCILNPEYVVLGGTSFRKGCLPLISECLYGFLPSKMSAELLYSEDKWHDYFCGYTPGKGVI